LVVHGYQHHGHQRLRDLQQLHRRAAGLEPEVISYIRTDLSSVTSVRYWCGWASADPAQSATPLSALAAFRYDSTVDTDGNWRAVTSTGNSVAQTSVTNTGIPVTAGGRYRLRVLTTPDVAQFYIDNVLVATHTTNLPPAAATIGWCCFVTTLASARRSILWSRTAVMHD